MEVAMRRFPISAAILLGLFLPARLLASTGEQGKTLVLPLRTVGINDTTAIVVRDLLAGELETRGLSVVNLRALGTLPPSGPGACDDVDCAGRLAGEYQAAQVVYGSLSKLGGKVLVRVRTLRAGESAPYYADQFSAVGEEDLDVVMRRVAEGISTGRPNSDRATVESITGAEALTPRRRLVRSGPGVRAGFLYPRGESYAGKERLTHFRVVWKMEAKDFLVETSTILGWNATGNAVDWTLLDLFGARIFGLGDMATYAGGGVGLHRVSLEREVPAENPYNPAYPYMDYKEQTATAFTADVGGGLLLLRTYNFHFVVDLRYHVVFDGFTNLNGKGAHGVILSFGINH
jgi:hypothetical protein